MARAIWAAEWTPLWLDEVLSVWASRLSSGDEIWSAIQHGSEFAPPTYPLLLHYCSRLFGGSYLLLRLPSLVGVCVFAGCSFVLLRRYVGLAAAMFGCSIVLESLRIYALQVRPYVLCSACFAGALLCWDLTARSTRRWPTITLCLLLICATCLHFYGVLFVPCLGIIEALRYFRTKNLRVGIWVSLFFAGIATAAWLPLIRILSAFNAGDTASSAYYGKPNLTRLIFSYFALLIENHVVLVTLLALIAGMAIGKMLRVDHGQEAVQDGDANFLALSIGVSALPIVVFVFSIFVTHTFNNRYVISTAMGLVFLIIGALAKNTTFRFAAPIALLVGTALTISHRITTYGTFERLPVFRTLAGGGPIVVADVQQFFTLRESAPDEIRRRLVYVRMPDDVIHRDPTVVNQLYRWKTIDPTLPIQNADAFLHENQDFFVLDTHSGTDDTPLNYFLDKHRIHLVRQFDDGTLLFKSNTQF